MPTVSVLVNGITVNYQSFISEFTTGGEKCVVVYSKQEDKNFWIPVALFTWLTTADAISYFNQVNMDDLKAHHCEFYFAGWVDNDNGTTWPDLTLRDDETLRTSLGISDALGFFIGDLGVSSDNVFVTPEEILNGQKIVILEVTYYPNSLQDIDDGTVINSVSFSNSSSSSSSSSSSVPEQNNTIIYIIFFVIILILFKK